MSDYVIDCPPQPAVSVQGGGLFPVRRIFCIGKNYAKHVREMGGDPKKDSPVFFTKPADAVAPSGAEIPYPPGTEDFHFEGELVVALGRRGENLKTREDAGGLIYGTSAGCDLTRRDLQAAAKKAGGPWDAAKGFDKSAPLGAIMALRDFSLEDMEDARLVTTVNGETRQDAPLKDMIWSAPEIIMALSTLFELKPGDLIFTGTPDGVGPLTKGDKVAVEIGALPKLHFSIA